MKVSKQAQIASLILAAGTAGSAFGQAGALTPLHGVTNNIEHLAADNATGILQGSVTILFDTVDAGGDNTIAFADAEIDITFLDDMGNQVGLTQTAQFDATGFATEAVQTDGMALTANNGDTNLDDGEIFVLDFGAFAINAPAAAVGVQLSLVSSNGADDESATPDTLTDNADASWLDTPGNDATDERFAIIRQTPTLTGAFLSDASMGGGPDTLNLTFSLPDVNLDPATTVEDTLAPAAVEDPNTPGEDIDNPNRLLPATPPNGSLEFSTDGGMTFNTLGTMGATDINGNATINANTISFPFDETSTNLVTGIQLRPTPTTTDIRGAGGAPASGTVTTGTLQPIDVDTTAPGGGVAFLTTTLAGADDDAIAVTFDAPVDPGDPGDTDFYDNIVAINMGGPTDPELDVTGVEIDPENPNRVLLDIDSSGVPQPTAIAANATSDGTGSPLNMTAGLQFELQLSDGTGNPPSGLFGADDDFSGTSNVTIGDQINPQVNNVAFGDFGPDGLANGEQDAVVVLFNEPLATDVSENGVTLRRDAATVNPVDEIDPDTGAFQTRTVVTSGDAEDEIDIVSVSVIDVDQDLDGTISALEENSGLRLDFDPTMVDWNNDGTVGDDEEATPGSSDFGAVSVEIDVDATDFDIGDNGGALLAADFGPTDTDFDLSPPVVVPGGASFITGDNGSPQEPFEADGTPGDQQTNDTLRLALSEAVQFGGPGGLLPNDLQTQLFNHNGTPFAPDAADGGDGTNLITIQDNGTGAPTNFDVGDMITILAGNGVFDTVGFGSANELAPVSADAALTAEDGTAPYVALFEDVNGNAVSSASAMLNDQGFIESIRLPFISAEGGIDPASFADEDFTIGAATQPTAALDTDDNTVLILSGIAGSQLTGDVDVTYNGAGLMTTLADGNGNAVGAADVTQQVGEVNQPFVDSEFTANALITGNVIEDEDTMNRQGTKVFGLVAVPTVKAVSGTVGSGSSSVRLRPDDFTAAELNAVTNFVLGLEPRLYLHASDGAFTLSNSSDVPNTNDPNDRRGRASLTLPNNVNLENLSLTGNLVPADSSDRTRTERVTVDVSIRWGILGSNDGTAAALLNTGIGDTPIVSREVISNEGDAYDLHVGAPIGAFSGLNRLGADEGDFPIIVIVELPEGDRFVASTLLLRAASGDSTQQGSITFSALQRQPVPGELDFNIDLANIDTEFVYEGWNIVSHNRQSGFIDSGDSTPPNLPVGVQESDVFEGDVIAATALDQFVFFDDTNDDGVYSAADDNAAQFDSLGIGPLTHDFSAFTLTDRGAEVLTCLNGVTVAESLTSFVGGFAFGYFVEETAPNRQGIFQLGAAIEPGSDVFGIPAVSTLPSSTLNWLLLTNTGPDIDISTDGVDSVEVVLNNGGTAIDADFIVEYIRSGIGNSEGDVTVRSAPGAGLDTILSDEGYFINANPNDN